MSVRFFPDKQAWLLETQTTAYAFGINSKNQLAHFWWGSRLSQPEDYPGMGNVPNQYKFENDLMALEYPGWGGLYFTEPCLKVTFSDNVRDLVLTYQQQAIVKADNYTQLEITLHDTVYSLAVKLFYRVFDDSEVMERWATICNTSEQFVTLEQVMSGTFHLPNQGEGQYCLTHLAGRWGAEFQVTQTPITDGKKVIESRQGHTSNHASPWFALNYIEPDGTSVSETHGQVWFGTLGWSGNWLIAIDQMTHPTQRAVQVTAGINTFDFSWHLEPQQSFETPILSFGYTEAGLGAASRNLHQYELRHILPATFANQLRPVLYNSWEPIQFQVNEESQLKLAERAAELGVELFVVDDGWFGARDNDRAGLGDWFVSTSKLPHGLGPLIRQVNALGMQFGIWVEPEMVNPDSELYRAHPDWVYHFPTRVGSQQRNQLVLNLSRPDVQTYLFKVLDALLADHNISFIKWDYNRSISEPGWPDAPAVQQREMWVRSTQAFYQLLDRLRAAHSTVTFESCSSGGGRVDLGVLRRTDQVWTSDNTDPYDRLFIQEGFSQAYAPKAMYCWVVDSPHWLNNRHTPLSYRFHSSMMGSLGIGGHITSWSEEDRATARQLIAQYKEIRHLVQNGLLYRLLSPRRGSYTAVAYVSQNRQEAVLFVLTMGRRHALPVPRIRLAGLEPAASYQCEGLDSEPLKLSGQTLMAHGLDFPKLAGDFGSVIVRLKAL